MLRLTIKMLSQRGLCRDVYEMGNGKRVRRGDCWKWPIRRSYGRWVDINKFEDLETASI